VDNILPRLQARRAIKGPPVPRKQETASHRHAEHLVRVDSQAVGAVGTLQPPLLVLGEGNGATPRPVDMEPETVTQADVGDLFERIVGTEHSGSSTGIDVERCIALLLRFDDFGLKV